MRLQSIVRHLTQKLSTLIDVFLLEPDQITSHDRTLLEQVILPYFTRTVSVQKVLFVGCSAYTQRYKDIFDDKGYWTIDPKSAKRKFGSDRHIIDSITHLGKHVSKNYFDVILMNGVIGFGLNRVGDIGQAIAACYEALASGGILLVGWNDTASRTPIEIGAIRTLRRFDENCFEPLQACHYRTEGSQRHTFSFYRKA